MPRHATPVRTPPFLSTSRHDRAARTEGTHLESHRIAETGREITVGCTCAIGHDHGFEEGRAVERLSLLARIAGWTPERTAG